MPTREQLQVDEDTSLETLKAILEAETNVPGEALLASCQG